MKINSLIANNISSYLNTREQMFNDCQVENFYVLGYIYFNYKVCACVKGKKYLRYNYSMNQT